MLLALLAQIARDINNEGQIVGASWSPDAQHGFTYSDGNYTIFDVPGQEGRTNGFGINDRMGKLLDITWGNYKNFLLSDGVFTNIDISGETWVLSWGINNAGQITTGENYIASPIGTPVSYAYDFTCHYNNGNGDYYSGPFLSG